MDKSTTQPLVLVVEDYQDARGCMLPTSSGYRWRKRPTASRRSKDGRIDAGHHPDGPGIARMDGWEATRRLKLDERTKHIPIVALTGHALAGHAEGARQRDATRS